MDLEYKEDWQGTSERLRAWWRGEFFGRCAIDVTAPKKNPLPGTPPPPAPTSLEERFQDLDGYVIRSENYLRNVYFGGESLPTSGVPILGVACVPALFGCPMDIGAITCWFHPMLKDPDRIGAEDLRLDPENPNYRFVMRVLEFGARKMRGKAILSVGPILGCGDTLAALRGIGQVLLDCAERPEQVYAAEKHLNAIWMDYFDRCFAITKDASDGGSTNWLNVWAPGKYYPVQCDLSFNIGTGLFRELFLPIIREQTEFLDYSLYHLDGVNAFRHLDALLELPRLHAIQFFPGTNKPSPLHFMALLKKIQAAEKAVYLHLTPDEVEPALKSLSARLLYIQTSAKTEDEARALVRNVEKWSVNR
jgi:5-methyltetrahydrofolate--homocysteine methyltransferase